MRLLSLALTCATVFSANAYAQDYVLTLKDHTFSPQELALPANEKVTIIVKNNDASPAEFESDKLGREKVIAANSEGKVLVGPLKAGSYEFVDDFHRDTAKGTITVQ